MRLSELQNGQSGVIIKVLGYGAFRKRVTEMGFVRGQTVEVVMNAPLKDPILYKVMGYEVSLRRSEASMIKIATHDEASLCLAGDDVPEAFPAGGIADDGHTFERYVDYSKKEINIALVGNPNCGKTSLFNAASGGHEHVGNYSGVTVDAKRGRFNYGGYRFVIYDLPGTYSLSAYSPEEVFVRRHLVERTPDVIVNVVAASNLERNLYLTTELIDMDFSMVIALNMYDELEQSGARFDHDALGRMIGVPIVPTVSRGGRMIDGLLDTIIRVYENQEPAVRHVHINYSPDIEAGIAPLKNAINASGAVSREVSPRYVALKMLQRDTYTESILRNIDEYPAWAKLRDQEVPAIERKLGEDIETAITNERYGFIAGALKETFEAGKKDDKETTRAIDAIVTNKLFGFPIFLLILWLMFETTFSLGSYPMGWIEAGVGWLADAVRAAMSDGMLKDLIIDGVIGGVGGVIVFLPNILILYLFISFMEDSGYMARAAFIMDKLMHRIGLHGKSFIPLIMGFGCNVPAIMASRTIESRSSRIITILINPFISCSARLPVYLLLVGIFFPSHAGTVLMGLYLLGMVAAVVTARLLRRFVFKKDETPFVMELPPYRMPAGKSIIIHMWDKAKEYLKKMGGVILVASMAIWFLSYFPRTTDAEALQDIAVDTIAMPGVSHAAIMQMEQQKNSYLGRLGLFCEPVVEPLGFNWKVCISLLSGAAAKELVISTLGVLYAETDVEGSGAALSEKLTTVNPQTGTPDFTARNSLAFLVFILLYFPCIASLAAIARETGNWRWTLFTVIYNTLVAWIAAWATYNIWGLFD